MINLYICTLCDLAERNACPAPFLLVAEVGILVAASVAARRIPTSDHAECFLDDGMDSRHTSDDDEEVGFQATPVDCGRIIVCRVERLAELDQGVKSRDTDTRNTVAARQSLI